MLYPQVCPQPSLCEIIMQGPGGMYLHLFSPSPSSPLTLSDTRAAFQSLLYRHGIKREPVQYLVGGWDFHRIHLALAPPVLIPRPETEELVEWVLEEEGREEGEEGGGGGGPNLPIRFLDVGCGSGAIGLALLWAYRDAWPSR